MMFGRKTYVSILASFVWIGLVAAGCGPDGEEEEKEPCCYPNYCAEKVTPTECRSMDGEVVSDCDTDCVATSADTMGGSDGSDAGVDTSVDPDGGDAVDGTADAADTADDGGGDTTDAADTDDGGETDGGGDQESAFVGVGSTPMDTPATVYASSDPTSGDVDSKKTYETKQMVVDASAGVVYGLDRRCSGFGEQEDCKFDQGVVREFEVSSSGILTEIETYELPTGVYNPHGVGYVETGGDLFVSSYFTSDIYRFGSAGKPEGTRDVAPFDEDTDESNTDTDPEPSDISIHGDYVLITLLRLTDFRPEVNSALAVLDTADGSFVDFDDATDGVQALDLEHKNAKSGTFRAPNGDWTVGFTGRFQDDDMNTALDGAIVALDSSQPGDYSVGQTIVSEEDLGGNLLDYVMVGAESGVAMISSGAETSAVQFSSDGSVDTLQTLNGYSEALCVSPDAETVWVGSPDPEGQSAFVAYDTSNWSQISGAEIEVDETPSSCAFGN